MFTRKSHKGFALFMFFALAAFSVPQVRAADPGYIPQIAPDGTLINSPFFVNGNTVTTGQLSIDGTTGLITFAGGQSFPMLSLALPNTTSPTVGVLTLGGTPFLHNFGTNNTFVGASAGNLTMTGNFNSPF